VRTFFEIKCKLRSSNIVNEVINRMNKKELNGFSGLKIRKSGIQTVEEKKYANIT
jgi:hypothetical protein